MATRKNFNDRVLKRQEQAKVRQEASDKLTLEQKLAKAAPGSKEHQRLTARSQK